MKTKLWNGELMEIGPCLSCGFDDAGYTCGSYVSSKDGVVSCEKCASRFKMGTWTDANGDRLVWDDSLNGKYNYCLGEVVHSKRHLSEILRKNDMMQKGDFFNTKDKRWNHVRETGRAHTGRPR